MKRCWRAGLGASFGRDLCAWLNGSKGQYIETALEGGEDDLLVSACVCGSRLCAAAVVSDAGYKRHPYTDETKCVYERTSLCLREICVLNSIGNLVD